MALEEELAEVRLHWSYIIRQNGLDLNNYGTGLNSIKPTMLHIHFHCVDTTHDNNVA